jgi:hypothetical protein
LLLRIIAFLEGNVLLKISTLSIGETTSKKEIIE